MSRCTVITGASRGIGRAIALKLAEEGDELILTARTESEAFSEVIREAGKKSGNVIPFLGDLRDPAAIAELSALIRERFPKLDVLVNNAGISSVGLCQDSSDEEWLSVLHTNLSAAVRLSKEAVKLMVPRKTGRIINISSVFGLYGASCEAEYSAAKGGLNAYTKSLAKELAPSGIAVNAIAPGAIDTEMNARLTPEEREALEREIPAGRFGTPEEAAELVSLLLRAPVYLTGQIICLDGGWF